MWRKGSAYPFPFLRKAFLVVVEVIQDSDLSVAVRVLLDTLWIMTAHGGEQILEPSGDPNWGQILQKGPKDLAGQGQVEKRWEDPWRRTEKQKAEEVHWVALSRVPGAYKSRQADLMTYVFSLR